MKRKKPSKKPHCYSVSMIQMYEGCPRKFKGRHLEGYKSKPGWAAQRGLDVHAKAESFLLGRTRGLPSELKKLDSKYRRLKKTEPMCELQICVDKDWQPTGWWDDDGWCRGALDVITRVDDEEVIIVDHKTGRIYEDKHEEGAEVYTCLAAATVKDAESYHVEFWYTDQGEVLTWDYHVDDIPDLRASWDERARKMFSARRFPERPDEQTCKYCPVRSDKGGPCHGWKKA